MNMIDLNIKSHKSRTRVGRGISAGGGKTAGRGTKGQNSRSGGQRNPGFEGGQNPLMQRIPKMRGFRAIKPTRQAVKTSQLNKLKAGTVGLAQLQAAGLAVVSRQGVKLIFDEDIRKAYRVTLTGASRRAIESLEKAGGSFEVVKSEATKQSKTEQKS